MPVLAPGEDYADIEIPERRARTELGGLSRDGRRAVHPGPAPARRERVERQEPLHRLGRRRAHREGPRRGGAGRRADGRRRAPPRRAAHLACCAARSRPRSSRSTRATGSGSRCAAHWRLNERHYGALQGKDKKATKEEFGEEQFMLWRRSYDTPPPRIADDDECSQIGDARYADLPDEIVPRTECLKDVVDRMLPYWYDAIVPDLRAGRTVCVTAHGNSLRALVKHLDDMSEEAVVGLNIPTGIPLVYRARRGHAPGRAGRAVPRPRRGGRRHPGRRQPGPLMDLERPQRRLSGAFVRHLGLEITELSGDRVVARWTAAREAPPAATASCTAACTPASSRHWAASARRIWFGDRGQVRRASATRTDFFRAVREGELTSVGDAGPPGPLPAGVGRRDARRRRPAGGPGPAAGPEHHPLSRPRGRQWTSRRLRCFARRAWVASRT